MMAGAVDGAVRARRARAHGRGRRGAARSASGARTGSCARSRRRCCRRSWPRPRTPPTRSGATPIARGELGPLVCFALAPFVLHALVRASATAATDDGRAGAQPRGSVGAAAVHVVLVVGLLGAVAGSVWPPGDPAGRGHRARVRGLDPTRRRRPRRSCARPGWRVLGRGRERAAPRSVVVVADRRRRGDAGAARPRRRSRSATCCASMSVRRRSGWFTLGLIVAARGAARRSRADRASCGRRAPGC